MDEPDGEASSPPRMDEPDEEASSPPRVDKPGDSSSFTPGIENIYIRAPAAGLCARLLLTAFGVAMPAAASTDLAV